MWTVQFQNFPPVNGKKEAWSMKRHNWFIFAAMLVVMLAGCGKEDNPADSTGTVISETGLFPLTIGNKLVFDEYLLDSTNTRIQASMITRVTAVVDDTLLSGKQAFVLIDSVSYSMVGILDTLVKTFVTVEAGDLYSYIGSDWRPFFKKSAGMNSSYLIGVDSIEVPIFAFPLAATLTGTITAKEEVQTPSGVYSAYKLAVKAQVNLGTMTFFAVQYIYFADGVGIVKYYRPFQEVPSFFEIPGSEAVLRSKVIL